MEISSQYLQYLAPAGAMRVNDTQMSEEDGSVKGHQHGIEVRIVEGNQHVVHRSLLFRFSYSFHQTYSYIVHLGKGGVRGFDSQTVWVRAEIIRFFLSGALEMMN